MKFELLLISNSHLKPIQDPRCIVILTELHGGGFFFGFESLILGSCPIDDYTARYQLMDEFPRLKAEIHKALSKMSPNELDDFVQLPNVDMTNVTVEFRRVVDYQWKILAP